MAASHFTGPVISGSILNTSGSTLGQDVANIGSTVLSQSQAITQAASDTTALATSIVIPAYSQIVDIYVYTTTAWDATETLSVGTTATATELVDAASGPQTVGVSVLSPGTNATRTGKWINVGSSDVRIYVLSSADGAGVGTIAVRYVQGINAP